MAVLLEVRLEILGMVVPDETAFPLGSKAGDKPVEPGTNVSTPAHAG